jgi:D-alanyl-lipoteichoic acid acyltransferase DltB (MBOAT superfamily)
MLFNSFAFFIFFPVVTGLYFLLNPRWRWGWLLAASCFFYMYFVPKYILILGFTIVVDYFAGIFIERAAGTRRKLLLSLSIAANVGVLAVFKYFNFLNDNIEALSALLGWNYSIRSLALVLPIGLSFHTFQAMSYTIEVYRGKQKAERHFGIYALYVMFYPQLVAGPIERPQNLLPQFREVHEFDYEQVTSGLKLIAWGLFKKCVVADRLAVLVNSVYAHPSEMRGPLLALASLLFGFQVFCDFGGYSDVAIGSARVMGFRLMQNFDRPFHSRSLAEFWRRWHISLSTWFRDYLYIPLGGNRVSAPRRYANIMILFLLCGLWHGANWTYVLWGGMHGAFLVFGALTRRAREKFAQAIGLTALPALRAGVQIVTTNILIGLTCVMFRSNSVPMALEVFRRLLSGWLTLLHPSQLLLPGIGLGVASIGIGGMLVVELVHVLKLRQPVGAYVATRPLWLRWSVYYALVCILLFLHARDADQFIYFQF